MTDRHLVTAAHCLAGVEPGLFSMVDILLRHYGGPGAGAAVRRKMEAVTIHPAFNEDTLQNDIAVVRLRRPVSIVPGAARGQQTTPHFMKLLRRLSYRLQSFFYQC